MNQQRTLNQILKQGEMNVLRGLSKMSPDNINSYAINMGQQKKINRYRFISNEVIKID
jgi:hypothetical protein